MTDGFTDLIARSNEFFTGLAQNNRKDWYEPRKTFFTAEIRKPAELLAGLLAEDLARLTGKAHKPKVFRIYRDVRFSKDKTPYNAHLHLMWAQPGTPTPVWFFGSAPDYLIVGMGIMGLQGASLTRYREFVDNMGDDIAAVIEGASPAGAAISDWGPEPLKRVPKPYDPDHPHGGLLRRKSLAVNVPLAEGWQSDGLIASTDTAMKVLMPLWRIFDGEFR